jgi:hypothetical protein
MRARQTIRLSSYGVPIPRKRQMSARSKVQRELSFLAAANLQHKGEYLHFAITLIRIIIHLIRADTVNMNR